MKKLVFIVMLLFSNLVIAASSMVNLVEVYNNTNNQLAVTWNVTRDVNNGLCGHTMVSESSYELMPHAFISDIVMITSHDNETQPCSENVVVRDKNGLIVESEHLIMTGTSAGTQITNWDNPPTYLAQGVAGSVQLSRLYDVSLPNSILTMFVGNMLSQPSGSYLYICNNISWNGQTLSAVCRGHVTPSLNYLNSCALSSTVSVKPDVAGNQVLSCDTPSNPLVGIIQKSVDPWTKTCVVQNILFMGACSGANAYQCVRNIQAQCAQQHTGIWRETSQDVYGNGGCIGRDGSYLLTNDNGYLKCASEPTTKSSSLQISSMKATNAKSGILPW